MNHTSLKDLWNKYLGIHEPGAKQIVYKLRQFNNVATLPRSGHSAETPPKAQSRILCEEKNSWIVAKALKTSLDISVHEPIMYCISDLTGTMEETTLVLQLSKAEEYSALCLVQKGLSFMSVQSKIMVAQGLYYLTLPRRRLISKFSKVSNKIEYLVLFFCCCCCCNTKI